jgi:hypothetical protein
MFGIAVNGEASVVVAMLDTSSNSRGVRPGQKYVKLRREIIEHAR